MNNPTKSVETFIAQIANKNYSQAQSALSDAVAEKIKNKIRTYLTQKNNS